MKERIVSALVLAGMIASTSAFASKARELVLGHGGADMGTGLTTATNTSWGYFGGYGSFYYDSDYNMFYNPAYINDFKNWAAFEKGTVGNGEFGFATSMMNFNLGLYFNRKSATPNLTTANPDVSTVDLMFGGDAGVKWGLGLTYGQGHSTATNAQTSLTARAGVEVAGLDPFVGVTVEGQDKTSGVKTMSYSGINAGARYHYGEWVPYAFFGNAKAKTEATGVEEKGTAMGVGLGRETKLAEGARLVYTLYYKHNQVDNAGVKTKTGALPIQAGVEADALSWLTLRAGVNHTLIGNGAKLTTARVGGTFHIAKVDVDYAFGNGNATAGTDASDSADVGFDSSTFHQVSLRYSW
jgi:hypothetical protein